MELPTDEQWPLIDGQILNRDIIGALKQIKTVCGVSLNDAKDIHIQRYRLLREERNTDFVCSDEEYWRGVYG